MDLGRKGKIVKSEMNGRKRERVETDLNEDRKGERVENDVNRGRKDKRIDGKRNRGELEGHIQLGGGYMYMGKELMHVGESV